MGWRAPCRLIPNLPTDEIHGKKDQFPNTYSHHEALQQTLRHKIKRDEIASFRRLVAGELRQTNEGPLKCGAMRSEQVTPIEH